MYDDDCQEVLYFRIYRNRREGTPPVAITVILVSFALESRNKNYSALSAEW